MEGARKRMTRAIPRRCYSRSMSTVFEILGVPPSENALSLYCSDKRDWKEVRTKTSLVVFVRWAEKCRWRWREMVVDKSETLHSLLQSVRQWVPEVGVKRSCDG